jgi:serine/threonine protein phosphatase PrpC
LTVLRSGSASDVGRVRTVNQDLPLIRPDLYAVADGMGGHVGGEVAARVAVETLEQAFERVPTVDGLREAFSEANAAVWHESQSNRDLRGMGTTLTAVALVGGPEGRDVLALANVGDSRAYVFSGGEITQVTDDHSLAEERMRHGEMTEEEAAVHPQRHILTRALGVSAEVEADMWELELHTGDRVILCSDGLTNEVGTDEMAASSVRSPIPRKRPSDWSTRPTGMGAPTTSRSSSSTCRWGRRATARRPRRRHSGSSLPWRRRLRSRWSSRR